MLNSNQRAAIAIGAVAAALLILFPPYFDTGGLYGGAKLAFLLLPPAANDALDIRPALAWESLIHELVAAVSFTLAAVVSAAKRSSRSAKGLFLVWASTAVAFLAGSVAFSFASTGRGWTAPPFLFCLIPLQYPGGCFLFCLRMALIAFCCLTSVLLASERANESKIVGAGWAAVAISLLIIGLSAFHAASR